MAKKGGTLFWALFGDFGDFRQKRCAILTSQGIKASRENGTPTFGGHLRGFTEGRFGPQARRECKIDPRGRSGLRTVFTGNPQNRQKVPKIGEPPFLTNFWEDDPRRSVSVFSVDSLGGQDCTPFSPEIPKIAKKGPKWGYPLFWPFFQEVPPISDPLSPVGGSKCGGSPLWAILRGGGKPHFWAKFENLRSDIGGNFPKPCF